MHRGHSRRGRKRLYFSSFSSSLFDETDTDKHDNNNEHEDLNLPQGPVFYATQEDFERSPIDFINKIRPIAQNYGICKIIPPITWNPPFGTFVYCYYCILSQSD